MEGDEEEEDEDEDEETKEEEKGRDREGSVTSAGRRRLRRIPGIPRHEEDRKRGVRAFARTCVRTYVRACVRACGRACVRACARANERAAWANARMLKGGRASGEGGLLAEECPEDRGTAGTAEDRASERARAALVVAEDR